VTVSVGVDIGGTKMLLIARSASGALLAETLVATGPAATGLELDAAIADFRRSLDAPVERIAVAVPGLIDPSGTVTACDVLPRLAGWRPAADLVINDIRAALASVPASPGPVLCIVAGTAIGAAFTGTSGPFTGADGWAGELGYLPMRDETGAIRRLDELAGGASLLARLGISAGELHRLLDLGDSAALTAVRTAGSSLGLGLATCVNLLNPRRVVLGGGTCRFAGYRAAALSAAAAHSLPASWSGVRVERFVDERRFAADGAVVVARGGSEGVARPA
jgi:glucokinase